MFLIPRRPVSTALFALAMFSTIGGDEEAVATPTRTVYPVSEAVAPAPTLSPAPAFASAAAVAARADVTAPQAVDEAAPTATAAPRPAPTTATAPTVAPLPSQTRAPAPTPTTAPQPTAAPAATSATCPQDWFCYPRVGVSGPIVPYTDCAGGSDIGTSIRSFNCLSPRYLMGHAYTQFGKITGWQAGDVVFAYGQRFTISGAVVAQSCEPPPLPLPPLSMQTSLSPNGCGAVLIVQAR